MSTLKTPDNAMLPEPVGSPVASFNGKQAKGRNKVATAKQRKMIARALLKKLNEDNCEQYGVSKVEISRLREAAYGPR